MFVQKVQRATTENNVPNFSLHFSYHATLLEQFHIAVHNLLQILDYLVEVPPSQFASFLPALLHSPVVFDDRRKNRKHETNEEVREEQRYYKRETGEVENVAPIGNFHNGVYNGSNYQNITMSNSVFHMLWDKTNNLHMTSCQPSPTVS